MIRYAVKEDAENILAIYSYYVKNTAISFEYDVPSLDEFRERISCTLKRYPYLVAEEKGVILGYAYAGVFKDRAAYNHCCEVSIYVERNLKGRGYGRMLYEALEAELGKKGILNLYACIADPVTEDEYLTRNSEHFHRHMGYNKVGKFHNCGYKFDRWYNMIWMEKIIGNDPDSVNFDSVNQFYGESHVYQSAALQANKTVASYAPSFGHISLHGWNLESYVFYKLKSGDYKVSVTAGDRTTGGSREFFITPYCFEAKTYEEFLDRYLEIVPDYSFGLGKKELLPDQDLKKFLGY